MADCIKIVVGFDQREAIAYHAFSQSVLEKSSLPVLFLPLSMNSLIGYKETHQDKSNDFVYSRFLTPYLNNFQGWAIFADGDMVCQSDIRELWVMHDYKTKFNQKYLGNTNENYPRKNWSSLILWNCSHPKHKVLTPDFISNQTGKYLHRFSWLDDEDIGELPIEWNWLAIEYPNHPKAKIVHYTLGTPCFKDYRDSEMSDVWHEAQKKVNEGMNK
jgi:lipopolysaccharide biosynthesis glycosyltransferase